MNEWARLGVLIEVYVYEIMGTKLVRGERVVHATSNFKYRAGSRRLYAKHGRDRAGCGARDLLCA